MKIVSVMTTGSRGGAEFAAVEMLDALSAAGHETVMVSNQPAIGRDTRVRVREVDLGPKLSTKSWRSMLLRWPLIVRSLYKALDAAKSHALELYKQTAAMPAMLPWLVAHLEEARREMGEDWWPYGLEPNRHVLDTFLRYHHEQGLSKRRLQPEELFAPETLEAFKV
jgi:hypothetical protein